MTADADPEPISLEDVILEGGRIAAVLLFWGALAAFARYGIGNVGRARPGHFFYDVGSALALLLVFTGLASVLVYAIARGIQLSRR